MSEKPVKISALQGRAHQLLVDEAKSQLRQAIWNDNWDGAKQVENMKLHAAKIQAALEYYERCVQLQKTGIPL